MQAKWRGFIMGGFPEWWLGHEDGRLDQPFASPERWDQELKASGFAGMGAVAWDNDKPYQVFATMIAQPAQPPLEKKPVTLLYRNKVTEEVKFTQTAFEESGHAVTLILFTQNIPTELDIISTLELDTPFLHRMDQEDFDKLMKLSQSLEGTKLVWLMRPASMGIQDPNPRANAWLLKNPAV